MSNPSASAPLSAERFQKAEHSLSSWIKRGAPPSVLMLTGGVGVGKRTFARQIAQWVHCEQGLVALKKGPPCGQCVSCRKHQNGTVLDFIEMSPSISASGQESYKIEQFRDLKATLGFGAYENQWKGVLISNAEKMNAASANSLLKLLEEPPAGWFFLLTCTDRALLLPTVASRCQFLRVPPYSKAAMQQYLFERLKRSRNLDESQTGDPSDFEIKQTVARIVGISGGSVTRAIECDSESEQSLRAQLELFFKNPRGQWSTLLDWVATNEPVRALSLLCTLLEENLSQRVRAPGAAAGVDLEEAMNAITEVRRLLQTPVNTKLLAADLLLRFVSVPQSAGLGSSASP